MMCGLYALLKFQVQGRFVISIQGIFVIFYILSCP